MWAIHASLRNHTEYSQVYCLLFSSNSINRLAEGEYAGLAFQVPESANPFHTTSRCYLPSPGARHNAGSDVSFADCRPGLTMTQWRVAYHCAWPLPVELGVTPDMPRITHLVAPLSTRVLPEGIL
jgi:hypothetical protein